MKKLHNFFTLTLTITLITTFAIPKSQAHLSQKPSNLITNREKQTQSYEDWVTDNIFYTIRPEMRNRKIRRDQTLYLREWKAIETVVLRNGLCWECDGWDTQDVNDVTDAVFYVRHPELNRRKIQAHERGLANEWRSIYNRLGWDD